MYKYETIAEEIRQYIYQLPKDEERLPAERTLAERFQVNRLTLRKALALLEKEQLIYRDTVRGTFIGRQRARTSTHRVVALVMVGRTQEDVVHGATAFELEAELKRQNASLMLFSISTADEVESVLTRHVQSGLLSGIILSGLTSLEVAMRIRALGLPLVLFGHLMEACPEEELFDRVFPDSLAYGRRAVEALLERFDDVALINGPAYQWFQNVQSGYLQALTEAGRDYEEGSVVRVAEETESAGREAALSLLKQHSPGAIFVASERLCAGVRRALDELQLPTPPCVMTASTRDWEAGALADGFVRLDWPQGICRAVELLMARFGGYGGSPRKEHTPFTLIKPNGSSR